MSRFSSIFWRVFGVVFLIILLGFGLYYLWFYLSDERQRMAVDYLVLAEEKVNAGDRAGLWELNKAYMLGNPDVTEYRKKEGIYLARLNDRRAEMVLSDLIEKSLVNDDVWFEFGLILMDKKEFDRAEYVLNQISANVGEEKKQIILINLAYIEGTRGNWEGTDQYLQRAGDIKTRNDFYDRLVAGEKMISGEINNEFLSADEVETLNNLRGDLFVLKVADLLINRHLNDWARVLLNELYWQSEDKVSVSLMFARSYLDEGDCRMAEETVEELKWLAGECDEVKELKSGVKKCRDLSLNLK